MARQSGLEPETYGLEGRIVTVGIKGLTFSLAKLWRNIRLFSAAEARWLYSQVVVTDLLVDYSLIAIYLPWTTKKTGLEVSAAQ